MNERLAQKVALVTGSSRGIGRAIALALAGGGATVVLTGRDKTALAGTADEIKRAGGRVRLFAADLAAETEILDLVGFVRSECGRLDILVNNAGLTFGGPVGETSTATWDALMAVNARAPYILCRELLPLLRAAERGYIINISSVVGVKGYAQQTAYTASKHALRGLSIALAEELRGTNVRVHVVCPGGVATELVTRVRPDIKTDELIQPGEVAELVLYLVTHQGNAVMDELHLRRATAAPWF